MADPLTLAAGLGAAGIGYSMYRYGVRPTLRGLARGTAYGVGAVAGLTALDRGGEALINAMYAEPQRVADARDLRRISALSFPNTPEEYNPEIPLSEQRRRNRRRRHPDYNLYPEDQNPQERFDAVETLTEKLSPLAAHYLYRPGGPRTIPLRENFEIFQNITDPFQNLTEKLTPLAAHYVYRPGGPREADLRRSFENNVAAIDLQSAAEHVFGQDQDGDEYPDPYVGRPSYSL